MEKKGRPSALARSCEGVSSETGPATSDLRSGDL